MNSHDEIVHFLNYLFSESNVMAVDMWGEKAHRV